MKLRDDSGNILDVYYGIAVTKVWTKVDELADKLFRPDGRKLKM